METAHYQAELQLSNARLRGQENEADSQTVQQLAVAAQVTESPARKSRLAIAGGPPAVERNHQLLCCEHCHSKGQAPEAGEVCRERADPAGKCHCLMFHSFHMQCFKGNRFSQRGEYCSTSMAQ
jgi:hypothetical protein